VSKYSPAIRCDSTRLAPSRQARCRRAWEDRGMTARLRDR
jgi:hypothetical protein